MTALETVLEITIIITFTIGMIAIGYHVHRILKTMGEIIAKQSERPDPDPGNPHEDTKANRDEDPR